jgi:hypothetical protein
MIPNYKLGFVRPASRAAPAPAQSAPQPAQSGVSRGPIPVTNSNRFSVNRLIHVKTSGGCRSCGS